MAAPIQKGHAVAALVMGCIAVVLGILVFILSIVVAGKTNFPVSYSPYWAGIAFVIPGVLGIVTGFTKNHFSMIAFMVVNIVAFIIQVVACFLIGLFVAVFSIYASQVATYCKWSNGYCRCKYNGTPSSYKGDSCDLLSSAAVMMIAICVFLVIAALITLASSILGCISICCSNTDNFNSGVVIQQQGGKY